jgi:hypothetical protein
MHLKKVKLVKQIQQKELLKGMSSSRRKAVELLFDDADVHYLAILQDDEAQRKLLSVGPTLDYPDLDAVQNVEIDGMTLTAYVDCRSRDRRASQLFVSKASIRERGVKSALLAAEKDRRDALTKNAQLMSEVLRLEDENQGLKEKMESYADLIENRDELVQRIELLDLRETELTRMEEALLTRMDQHLQKAAELEQWEENLFRRERDLSPEAVV